MLSVQGPNQAPALIGAGTGIFALRELRVQKRRRARERMTSLDRSRPIDNALGSTGPKTEDGKRRSRRNTVRHAVVVALEDIEDYRRLSRISKQPSSPHARRGLAEARGRAQ